MPVFCLLSCAARWSVTCVTHIARKSWTRHLASARFGTAAGWAGSLSFFPLWGMNQNMPGVTKYGESLCSLGGAAALFRGFRMGKG